MTSNCSTNCSAPQQLRLETLLSCSLVSMLCIQTVNSTKLPRTVWFRNPGVQFHHLLNLPRKTVPFRKEPLNGTITGTRALSAKISLMILKMKPGASYRSGFTNCTLKAGLHIANHPCARTATPTPSDHKIKGAGLLAQRRLCFPSQK